MRRITVEVWSEEDCLARGEAHEAERIPNGFSIMQAELMFSTYGRAKSVIYRANAHPIAMVEAVDQGEVGPSVCLFPKLDWEPGEEHPIAFALPTQVVDPDAAPPIDIKAGSGTVSFDLHITDPATGQTTTHHCSGEVK